MSANVFGAKKFIPTAPDKGSFPLDHEGKMLILGINNYTNYSVPSSQFLGECKEFYLKFMICLAENDNLTSACREDSKAYLGCRRVLTMCLLYKFHDLMVAMQDGEEANGKGGLEQAWIF